MAMISSVIIFALAVSTGAVTMNKRTMGPDYSNPFGNQASNSPGAAASAAWATTQVTGRWTDKRLSSTQRAAHLLGAMTKDEKVHMVHGACMTCPWVGHVPENKRLGIPPMTLHDGPQGVRNSPLADNTSTSWPGAMAVAASWDPDAAYTWGVAMGKEFHGKGVNVDLGPGLNLARVPSNGRNFEYMSGEDPYLGYKLAGPTIRGIQEQKVMACAKHWVVNSQEVHRMDGSEDVDERTLHEVYYPPFEAAIDAGLASVMCSYNQINGTHACENSASLKEDLKGTLGFKGFVMSDWGAVHSPSLDRGLDQEMPFGGMVNEITSAIGILKEADVDESVSRILWAMFQTGVMDEPVSAWDKELFKVNVTTQESMRVARELSADGTVLLKNEQKVLPLAQNKKIALIGFAGENAYPLTFGHGSGEVMPSKYVSPLEGITEAAGSGAEIVFDKGHDLAAAKSAAAKADYAVVFVGTSASEGGDRNGLSLDGNCKTNTFGREIPCDGPDDSQNALVSAIASANKNTVVVLSVPGAILMPWSKEVAGVLVNFMPGQESGHAIADVLFGKVNPNAKLPITMPNRENEVDFTVVEYPGIQKDHVFHMTYSEKLLVGYRWYDMKNYTFDTGFPFGHGLSYTSFEYSDMHAECGAGGGKRHKRRRAVDENCRVTFNVTNVGDRAGQEVAQLYLDFPQSAGEPLQLKGFQKTKLLAPGQAEQVVLTLTPRDLSIWDVEQHGWKKVKGLFKTKVGASSRDFRLHGSLTVQ